MNFIDGPRDVAMIAVAVLVIVATVIGVLVSAPRPEWKSVNLSFDVGGITSTGDVDLNNTASIYTPKLTACSRLHIMRAYNADVTFTVFFFDENDVFVSSVEVTGRQFNVDTNMPVSEDGRQAVGFRISVVDNNSKAAFSRYDAYQLGKKFEVEISTLAAD